MCVYRNVVGSPGQVLQWLTSAVSLMSCTSPDIQMSELGWGGEVVFVASIEVEGLPTVGGTFSLGWNPEVGEQSNHWFSASCLWMRCDQLLQVPTVLTSQP